MSKTMAGILRMPDELYWNENPLYRAQHNANRLAAADEIERLQAEVHRLREWIKDTGRQFDICTHSVLGGVCDGCGCKRAGGRP